MGNAILSSISDLARLRRIDLRPDWADAAKDIERDDPNDVGGDIAGGRSDLRQLFFRPMPKLDPYATSAPDVFLCSASTPPGGGVHGMCGYWAARSALRHRFGKKAPSLAPSLDKGSTSHILT